MDTDIFTIQESVLCGVVQSQKRYEHIIKKRIRPDGRIMKPGNCIIFPFGYFLCWGHSFMMSLAYSEYIRLWQNTRGYSEFC